MNEETKVPPMVSEAQPVSSEGITTLNLSGQDTTTSSWGVLESHRQQMRSGAHWFFWIAGLSLVNSIAAATGSTWSFLAGLGITQLISGFAAGFSEDLSAVTVVAFILNLFVAGFFVFLGVFAQKGNNWAFIVGLVVYVVDGLIFLMFQLWFPLAFHAFVVYCLLKGLTASRKMTELEAEMTPATQPA